MFSIEDVKKANIFAATTETTSDEESVTVKGQLKITDNSDEEIVDDAEDGKQFDETLLDQLASFRIAKEYLRRKIADEQNQQRSKEIFPLTGLEKR
ncbi:hypothetical protein RB195_008599 [Necator americanus]|uniref:Uncharacterized protein n=1 Tax=Necator americanus TaxID=51031 RepID=A0ABR1CRA0_NECAM